MKRLITLAIVAGFVFCSSGTGNTATVRNTKHDFSQLLSGQVCAYCHSVHHAVGGLGRPAYMGADMPNIEKVYNSVTLDHELTTAMADQSDAPLCLTCHDGASLSLLTDVTIVSVLSPIIEDSARNLNLTLDLSNDHPVGFVFQESLDDGIVKPDPPVFVEFGPNGNEMWCSSCHNVHDNTYTPFLTKSNEGSALCYSCHQK